MFVQHDRICIYLAITAFTGGAHRRINVRLEFHFSGKWRYIWRLIGLGVAFVGFFFQAFGLYLIYMESLDRLAPTAISFAVKKPEG